VREKRGLVSKQTDFERLQEALLATL